MTSPNRIEQTARPAQTGRMVAGQANAPDASGGGFALILSLLGRPEDAPLALLPDEPADVRGPLQDLQGALECVDDAFQADAGPAEPPEEQAPEVNGLLTSPWALQLLVAQTVPSTAGSTDAPASALLQAGGAETGRAASDLTPNFSWPAPFVAQVPGQPVTPDGLQQGLPAMSQQATGNAGRVLAENAAQNTVSWLPTSLFAETGRLDGARAAQADAGAAGNAQPQIAAARLRPAVSWTVAAASTAAAEQLSGRRPVPAAVSAQPAAPVAASASLTGIAPARQDAVHPGAHAATVVQTAPLAADAAEAVLAQGAGQGADAGLPAARRGDARTQVQEPVGAAAPGIDSTQSVPGSEGASSGAWQDGSADAQAQLAEDVAWWASQQTQSAALTLDAYGQPVQVQVTLNGDQAHIVFHSDEAQARQLLDANVADLRALLDAQGLQLAGVTVGQSGGGSQGHAGQGHESGQPGADARRGQARVTAADGAGAAPARRVGSAERAVDIFV